MSWTATANKSDGKGGGFEKAPPGTHPAVLVGIIDLGHQWQDPYGGEGEGRHSRSAVDAQRDCALEP